MIDSKLLVVLRTLKGREFREFEQFLQSPFFNKNESICHLYEYLLPFKPAFSNKRKLSKSTLCQSLQITENQLAAIQHKLLDLLHRFLLVRQLEEHSAKDQAELLKVYQQRGLSNYFLHLYQKSKGDLQKENHRDADFYFRQFLLEKIHNIFQQGHTRHFRPELQTAAQSLDLYYLAEKSRMALEMLTSELVLEVEYENIVEIDWLLQALENSRQDHPSLEVYYHSLLLLHPSPSTESFHQLKELLAVHAPLFGEQELKDLYRNLLNFCTRRINHYREKQYYREFIDINQHLIENGLFLEKGVLAPWRYTNIIAAGLRSGELEWTKAFLEEKKPLLPDDYRDNIYQYNLGCYYFSSGSYGQAIQNLEQVDIKDRLLAIATKNMLIKSYYEADRINELERLLESYRIFILEDRNPLIKEDLRRKIQHFIDFTRHIYRTPPFEQKKLQALKQSLEQEAEILEKDWLWDKLCSKRTR
jgi:hypothetical protein